VKMRQVGELTVKEGRLMAVRESDQPIVLWGGGKAVHMGKGLTGIRSQQRKH
jgi:hypothetical protein